MCQRSVDKTYHASLADVAIEAQTYAYYVSASLLRLFTKSGDNFLKAWSHKV